MVTEPAKPSAPSAPDAALDPLDKLSERAAALEEKDRAASDASRRRASVKRLQVDGILASYIDQRRQEGAVDDEDTSVRRLEASLDETRRAYARRIALSAERITVPDTDPPDSPDPSTLPSARSVLLLTAEPIAQAAPPPSSPQSGPATMPPVALTGVEGRTWDYLHDRDVTVVVADDDRDLRSLIAAELEGLGYQVRQAENGLEAQNLAFEPPWPDLIVLDVRMPKIGGIGVARALADSDLAHVPILLVSGMGVGIPRQDGWFYLQKDGKLHDKMRQIIEDKIGLGRRRGG